jgi:nitrate reductase gamma subunit
MQFGRISGVALMVLGILLCGLQFVQSMTPPKSPAAADSSIARPEHKTSALPGIIGGASLVAGIVLLATGRRRDEPEAKHAVK